MNPLPKLLSKTKLMRGYRCLKCIYLTVHHPKLESPISPETQALFDQGNAVSTKAREYYPGGVLVDNKPWDFIGALTKTRELLASHVPIIYEAAFEYEGYYARADIIQYSPTSKRWHIFEVKSSTKVKPEHYDDVSIQVWIIANSGLPLEQIHIVHLNPDCYYPDLSNLFKAVDVTENIRIRYLSVRPKMNEILATLKQPNIPDMDIGSYCLTPTVCGFTRYCWQKKKIPDTSIFNLPKRNNREWELYHSGIIALDDPRLTNLNELQERAVTCFKTDTRYVNKEFILSSLSTWQFPLIFLDFETINPAMPRYDRCCPFKHVPFQFSIHIWESLDAQITYLGFLHDTPEDPRPTLIPALLKACREYGSIVAYFSKFEAQQIEALADYALNYRDSLLKLIDRLVDPLLIIRGAVYDNAFHGSFSLKNVAPALLGESQSYNGMMIANGSAAQRAFEELISPNTTEARKAILKNAMIEYCKKDTFVMLELVRWLYMQVQSK